jgi:hypothetical protein
LESIPGLHKRLTKQAQIFLETVTVTATTTFEAGFFPTNLFGSKDDIGPQEAAVEWSRGPIVAGHRAPGVLAAPLNGYNPDHGTPLFIEIKLKTKFRLVFFEKNKPQKRT